MSNKELHNPIKNKVLAKIKAGETRMRPKWHFILKTTLLAVGTVLATLTLLYLLSFVLFVLRQSGVWFPPAFWVRGLCIFFASLPWVLIALAIVFIVVLEVLVKRYAFAYRRPLLYSVVGIIILVLLGSVAISQTRVHQGFFKHAKEGRLPVAGPLYREFGMKRHKSVHPGIITEIADDGFKIENHRNEILTVIITAETRFPLGLDFVVDDEVVVLGERDNGTVTAFGIRRIDEQMMRGRGPDKHRRLKPHFFPFEK
jgi:hypothetical protein